MLRYAVKNASERRQGLAKVQITDRTMRGQ